MILNPNALKTWHRLKAGPRPEFSTIGKTDSVILDPEEKMNPLKITISRPEHKQFAL